MVLSMLLDSNFVARKLICRYEPKNFVLLTTIYPFQLTALFVCICQMLFLHAFLPFPFNLGYLVQVLMDAWIELFYLLGFSPKLWLSHKSSTLEKPHRTEPFTGAEFHTPTAYHVSLLSPSHCGPFISQEIESPDEWYEEGSGAWKGNQWKLSIQAVPNPLRVGKGHNMNFMGFGQFPFW